LQPDDHVIVARRLARAQAEVARNTVALVEQPQHRHPFGHRRGALRERLRRRGHRLRFKLLLLSGLIGLVAAALAAGQDAGSRRRGET